MSIPKGFKLVPVEPTSEMLIAGAHASGCLFVYAAMLAAATPPQPIYDEVKERELFCAFCVTVNISSEPMHVDLPFVFMDPITDYLWAGWKACAQSRAKSVEVGDE